MAPEHHKYFLRASGLVRAIFVALATLSILLVCFSIYQYSQNDTGPIKREPVRVLPDSSPSLTDSVKQRDSQGVLIGDTLVGGGKRLKLTLYRPDDDKALGEITFERYEPVVGSPDEIKVQKPELRMRTQDGHAVKTTADEALLDASLKAGIHIRRGRLLGNVSIEYDRLSLSDRNKLPAEHRDEILPSQIVEIRTTELWFDAEYAKLTVPGKVSIKASDLLFETEDLEVRVDEAAGRVDYLRIGQGGRLELFELGKEFALSLPGSDAAQEKRTTLAQWLRATIQDRLADARQATEPQPPVEPTPPAADVDDDTPTFRLDDDEENLPKPPVHYFAQFKKVVDVTKFVGDKMESRLQADVLEIIRAITDTDKERIRSKSTPEAPEGDVQEQAPPKERIVLTWQGRLVVEACTSDDERCADNSRSVISAEGSPVLVQSPENNLQCAALRYDPDGAKLRLEGTDEVPVEIRSPQRGSLTGQRIVSQRDGERITMQVTGPGTLDRSVEASVVAQDASSTSPSASQGVRFADRLDIEGHFETISPVNVFSWSMATRERRVMDLATFYGSIALSDGKTNIEADELKLFFSSPRHDDKQSIRRAEGRGNVHLSQGSNRVKSDEIDLILGTDQNGEMVPLTATARGNVDASQQDRTIRAKDELIMDFELVDKPAPPFDLIRAYARAEMAGIDPDSVDWDSRRKEHYAQRHRVVGARRLRATGSVEVVDPVQSLNVSAESIDCSIKDGHEIQKALVTGAENLPATVSIDTLTVTGREIRLDVPNDWAEIPGEGRMTFMSEKDLDGRKLDEPMPISITWDDWMKYHGRENRAVFNGNVHATSATTTTFDTSRLLVEFDEVKPVIATNEAPQDWWVFQDLVDSISQGRARGDEQRDVSRFAKEPAYILATGITVVKTAEIDDAGQLLYRARLSGPRLSVNLRSDVSKMLIEGKGALLLEDFRPAQSSEDGSASPGDDVLFSAGNDGPSKTLIEWHELMWYDFSIDQTRFEGDVSLKYFSGSKLAQLFGNPQNAILPQEGRMTNLSCATLTADFLRKGERKKTDKDQRMGELRVGHLRQFHASGSVKLDDSTEGLYLECKDLTYEQQRKLLLIQGTRRHKALIVRQLPGKRPREGRFEQCIYNLERNEIEVIRGGDYKSH